MTVPKDFRGDLQMDRRTRRLFYSGQIREALSHENPFLRHVTFAVETEAPVAGPGTTVSVDESDGEGAGIVLSVASSEFTEAQEVLLRKHGFEETEDTVLFGRKVYAQSVPRGTSYDDLVTFVEWSFVSVMGAPLDYTPAVAEIAGEKQSPGCVKGCSRAVRWLAIILFIGFVLSVLVSVIGGGK